MNLTPEQRSERGRELSRSYWDRMSPEQRTEEMQRRAAKREEYKVVRDLPTQFQGAMLTRAQVAEVLGVSTFWVAQREKTWPFYMRLSERMIRFYSSGFQKWLDSRVAMA